MLLSDPVLQELNRRPVAEGRVLPFPVVEYLDVFKGSCLDLGVYQNSPPKGSETFDF